MEELERNLNQYLSGFPTFLWDDATCNFLIERGFYLNEHKHWTNGNLSFAANEAQIKYVIGKIYQNINLNYIIR